MRESVLGGERAKTAPSPTAPVGAPARARTVLQLQRSAGNRAVGHLLRQTRGGGATPGARTAASISWDEFAQNVHIAEPTLPTFTDYNDFGAYMRAHPITLFGVSCPKVLPSFEAKIRIAEGVAQYLIDTYGGGGGFRVNHLSTFRSRSSNHGYGAAIDINAATAGYMMNEHSSHAATEAGERAVDQLTGPIFDRISWLMLGRESMWTHHRHSARAPGRIPTDAARQPAYFSSMWTDTQRWISEVSSDSSAMQRYFALTDASPEWNSIQSNLDSHWAQLGLGADPGTPAARKAAVLAQIPTDRATLRGRNASGGALATQGRADFPFHASDPAAGYLTVRPEIVMALRILGLRWGAVDFHRASGDVMHFDDKNRVDDIKAQIARHLSTPATPAAPAALAPTGT